MFWGAPASRTSLLVWSGATQATVDLGRIDVIVEDIADTDATSSTSASTLVRRRSLPAEGDADGLLVFDASSGSMPVAAVQAMRDQGPMHTGRYVLLAQLDSLQDMVEKTNALMSQGDAPGKGPIMNTRRGIQRLPLGGAGPVDRMWGETRVRIESQFPVPRGRSGFYLHDSKKGYTSGCVEARRNEMGLLFFDALVS